MKHSISMFISAPVCAVLLSTALSAQASDDMLPSHVWKDSGGNYQDDLGRTYVPDTYGNLKGPDFTLYKQSDGSYITPDDGLITPDGSGNWVTDDGYVYSPDGNGGYLLDEQQLLIAPLPCHPFPFWLILLQPPCMRDQPLLFKLPSLLCPEFLSSLLALCLNRLLLACTSQRPVHVWPCFIFLQLQWSLTVLILVHDCLCCLRVMFSLFHLYWLVLVGQGLSWLGFAVL